MQSGVLSSENLADVLRGISQRRRQGILEVTTSEYVTSIRFVQGRVVEVLTSKLTPVQETVEWFERAGYPVADPKQYTEATYTELQSRFAAELTGEFAVSDEKLQHVIRQRILDRLYKLDVGAGSFYTFKVQMVDHDRDFAPSISIGQLLLDLVELAGERDDFEQRFPENALLHRTGTTPNGLSPEETIVLQVIGEGAVLAELERRCLLSSYHFRHSLLELANNAGVCVVVGKANGGEPRADSSVESFLSDSVDAAFGTQGFADDVVDHDDQGTLELLVEPEACGLFDDDEEVSQSRTAQLYLLSARLLQNTVVPRVVAMCFILLALFAPLLLWRGVISLFADM